MTVKLVHKSRLRSGKSSIPGVSARKRAEITKDLEAYGQQHLIPRQRFVAPWHGSGVSQKFAPPERKSGSDKPSFKAIIEETETNIKLRIVVTGSSYAKLKYRWVVGGTRKRYASMTPDWESKTSPWNIESGAGNGWVEYVDKKRPRPGIEAREIDQILKEQLEPPFIEMIKNKYRIRMTITSRAGVLR